MQFDSQAYGEKVAAILALDGNGHRLMPLAGGACSSKEARAKLRSSNPADLFEGAAAPEAAMGGLWLYFSCMEECHELVQSIASHEGSYWHALLHRQEPDAGNAAYWFRRAGPHPVFPALLNEAKDILKRFPRADAQLGLKWDPFAFTTFCDLARQQPRSEAAQAALEIQRAEWQLLFDHCARVRKS